MTSVVECVVEQRHPVTLIRLRGRLDLGGAARVRASLVDCLTRQPAAVVVDLSELDAADDLLLTVFPMLYRQAAEWPGATILLCAARPELAEALRRADVTRRVPHFTTVPEAMAEAHLQPLPVLVQTVYLPSRDAPRYARAAVGEACRAWGVPEVTDTARVVTSELVANGVLHAGTMLELTVSLREGNLHIAVRDGDRHRVASNGSVRFDAESGRGLAVVEALAGSWGVVQTGNGKVVWASLRC